jgi:putative spermidine/putrescine transport system substrate-binding protein
MNNHRVKVSSTSWLSTLGIACLALALLACNKMKSSAAGDGTAATGGPKNPVTINVIDVGGALTLLQDAIEAYKKKHPEAVEKFNFNKAPAPELPGKLKAMQAAGRSDIDLVLGGTDILASGNDQGLWVKILPDHADKFPGVLDNYLPAAREMQ